MEDADRRVQEERARVEAEYRRVLKSAVGFEKGIRNRWREKNRQKNRRIAELEARVADLERRLQKNPSGEDAMDRGFKERKMVALIVNDLGYGTVDDDGMVKTGEQVSNLSDEELDRTLTERLGLSHPADEKDLEMALHGVEEPERLSEDATGATDMSHEPGPGENRD